MAIWIQSLSWTLVYALGQGLLIYVLLQLLLKATPGAPAAFRYRLSLVALAILPSWFAATWWREYQLLQDSAIASSSLQVVFV